MEVQLEILNPIGDNINGLCQPLINGTEAKMRHISKEILAQDIQKLPSLYQKLQIMDEQYQPDIRKEISRIEEEMKEQSIDFIQSVMKLQTLKNENVVLINRQLTDELVQ